MVLPVQWDKRTIKGTRLDFTGAPAVGSISFTPLAQRIKEKNTDAVIFAKKISIDLDGNGQFSIELPVSVGDIDITPYFEYEVLEQLQGAQDYKYRVQIDLALPEGTPYDLADLHEESTPMVGMIPLTRELADTLYQPALGNRYLILSLTAPIPPGTPSGTLIFRTET